MTPAFFFLDKFVFPGFLCLPAFKSLLGGNMGKISKIEKEIQVEKNKNKYFYEDMILNESMKDYIYNMVKNYTTMDITKPLWEVLDEAYFMYRYKEGCGD